MWFNNESHQTPHPILKCFYEHHRALGGQSISVYTALIEKRISLANGRKENQNQWQG